MGIFLDLRKAFDTVNHKILLAKLSKYGYSLNIVKWVENYLVGRQQRVELGNSLSNFRTLTCGVPQGSVLGQLLF